MILCLFYKYVFLGRLVLHVGPDALAKNMTVKYDNEHQHDIL